MMVLIVAIQIIPELSNSVSFTIFERAASEGRKKSRHKELQNVRFLPNFFLFNILV